MKTLHVPFHYYPDSVGGTEVYAAALADRLQRTGHPCAIAAPGEREETYQHEGIPVHRFAVSALHDVSELYDEGNALACEQFERILHAVRPELVHLHGMSPAISLRVLRAIRRRDIPVVLTVHIPGILCTRGTFLKYGTEVCDGVVEVQKCTSCELQSKGMPVSLASIVAALSQDLGRCVSLLNVRAPWATALRMSELQASRISNLRSFLAEVDHMIAVSGWLREVLLANGLPSEKVSLCRHGATQLDMATSPRRVTCANGVKRIAYVGRLIPAKGVHVLINALLAEPRLPAELDIYGIEQDDASYPRNLRAQAFGDSRIRFLDAVPNSTVLEQLRKYDVVAIPSIWLETGPLTVYDAFAAGVPVIGSRRGGIVELVRDEVDGILVEAGNVQAWSSTFRRICTEPGLLPRLRSGVKPPRSMDAVAAEMLELYEKIFQKDFAGASEASRAISQADFMVRA
jgi:glycosyltransferase involved in cell wall biosynthesis